MKAETVLNACRMRARETPIILVLTACCMTPLWYWYGGVVALFWGALAVPTVLADVRVYRRAIGRVRRGRPQTAVLAAWAFFVAAVFAIPACLAVLVGTPEAAIAGVAIFAGAWMRASEDLKTDVRVGVASLAPYALAGVSAPFVAFGAGYPSVVSAFAMAMVFVYATQAYLRRLAAERRHAAAVTEADDQRALAELVFRQSSVPTALYDTEMRLVTASARWFEDLRLSPTEAVGKTFTELTPWAPPHWREAYAAAVRGEVVRREEDLLTTPAGERAVTWEVRPWRHSGGRIGGVMTYGLDVTEQVMARRAREADAARLRLALENSGAAVWEIDLKTNRIHGAEEAGSVYSRTLTFDDLNPDNLEGLTDAERASLRRDYGRILSLKDGEGSVTFEHRIVDIHGRSRWVRVTSRRMTRPADDYDRILNLSMDVTAERRREMAFVDAMRRAERSLENRRALLVELGVMAPGVAAGRGAADETGDISELFHRLRQILSEIDARDAALSRAVGDLRAAQEASEKASVAKSQFIATMSHELRTPLNAIIGYSELLKEDAEDAGRDGDVADLVRIVEAARRLLRMIDEILDISKIEAGRMELERAPFDMAAMLRDAAHTVKPMAGEKGNTLTVDIAPDLGPAVGDAFRLGQCVINLMSNAVKFTRDGEVALRARREDADAGAVAVIEVSDTGIGISKDQLARLFEPFTQADSSTTRAFGGTGLGLAITRRLVQAMGGCVEVDSQPGVGSTFRLRVPLTAPATQAAADAQTQTAA